MVRNLNQLKKELRSGTRFEIIGHCHSEYIGQLRRVTLANTACFYSVVDGHPEHLVSRANGGKGFVLWWGKLPAGSSATACVSSMATVRNILSGI